MLPSHGICSAKQFDTSQGIILSNDNKADVYKRQGTMRLLERKGWCGGGGSGHIVLCSVAY